MVFSFTLLESRPGFSSINVSGPGVEAAFSHESGGHRFQRISPTERRGRVHTSTITVVVLPDTQFVAFSVDIKDIEESVCLAGGKGGQNVNKRKTAVQVKHKPTGIMVRCEAERSQPQNRAMAYKLLYEKLAELARRHSVQNRAQDRKSQAGTGQRGDKVRTIRMQDNVVTDHGSGTKMRADRYLKGFIEELWHKK